MSTPVAPPLWYREVRDAVVANMRSPLFALTFSPTMTEDPIARATSIVRSLPYHFDGERHRAYPWARALSRGHAACMDAAAFALAVAALVDPAGRSLVDLCYETSTTDPGYAHVRVYWRGVVFDPFPEYRRPVDACTASATLDALLDPKRFPTSLRLVGDVCHSCNNVRA